MQKIVEALARKDRRKLAGIHPSDPVWESLSLIGTAQEAEGLYQPACVTTGLNLFSNSDSTSVHIL